MRKRLLLIMVTCLVLSGCEDYDWRTKLIFEGRIVDKDGNPVSNITVGTYVDGIGWYNTIDSEIISHTKTDQNGYYTMMFPDPQSENDIMLLINADGRGNPVTPAFSTVVINNISEENFNDYLISFGEKKIFNADDATTFTVTANDDPTIMGEITNIDIQGMVQQNVIDYNLDYNEVSYTYFQEIYTAAANQSILVKYTIRTYGPTGPVYTTTEVPVQIGTQPQTFTINY